MRCCKGLCDVASVKEIKRPIYYKQRYCSKCECFWKIDTFICPCCKCQTRGKPVRSINRQKYIYNTQPIILHDKTRN